MTPEELAYQAELERQERIKRRYRELRSDLLSIQNKMNNLKANLSNLEEQLGDLIKIDDNIFDSDNYNEIKSETNNVLSNLGNTISKVHKEC